MLAVKEEPYDEHVPQLFRHLKKPKILTHSPPEMLNRKDVNLSFRERPNVISIVGRTSRDRQVSIPFTKREQPEFKKIEVAEPKQISPTTDFVKPISLSQEVDSSYRDIEVTRTPSRAVQVDYWAFLISMEEASSGGDFELDGPLDEDHIRELIPKIPIEDAITILGLWETVETLADNERYHFEKEVDTKRFLLNLYYKQEEIFDKYGRCIRKKRNEMWEDLANYLLFQDVDQLFDYLQELEEEIPFPISCEKSPVIFESEKTFSYAKIIKPAIASGNTVTVEEVVSSLREETGCDIRPRDIEVLFRRKYGDVGLGNKTQLTNGFARRVREKFLKLRDIDERSRIGQHQWWRIKNGLFKLNERLYRRDSDGSWTDGKGLRATGYDVFAMENLYQSMINGGSLEDIKRETVRLSDRMYFKR
jgi:hypothetical protein